MTKPMIKIVNSQTGEEIEREMNAAEFKQYEIDQANSQELKIAEASKAAAKAELLERLGITAEEAALLLG
jgi:hydroxymethylpyrimidine pyrophosphatase-like HAD family hydrolase